MSQEDGKMGAGSYLPYILGVLCWQCGSPLLSAEDFPKEPFSSSRGSERLKIVTEAVKAAKTRASERGEQFVCKKCGTTQPPPFQFSVQVTGTNDDK